MAPVAGFSFEENIEEQAWQAEARCNSGEGLLTPLFFSEALDDIDRARAFCGGCVVRSECFEGAVARREPWGVWGGELFVRGKPVGQKRPRGRPPAAKSINDSAIVEPQ